MTARQIRKAKQFVLSVKMSLAVNAGHALGFGIDRNLVIQNIHTYIIAIAII
jgi:hypothetical protein